MTLPALHNTGVLYRRILSQFPQDISLAFAYGSGVFKQQGTSQGQMEVSDAKLMRMTLNLPCELGNTVTAAFVDCACLNKGSIGPFFQIKEAFTFYHAVFPVLCLVSETVKIAYC